MKKLKFAPLLLVGLTALGACGGGSKGPQPLPPATALDLAKSIYWCFDYMTDANATGEEYDLVVKDYVDGASGADIWHSSRPDMYYFIEGYFGLEITEETVVDEDGVPTEDEFYWDELDFLIDMFDSFLPREDFEDPYGTYTPSRTYNFEADDLMHGNIQGTDPFPCSALTYKVDETLGVEFLFYAQKSVGAAYIEDGMFYCAVVQVAIAKYSVIAER